MRWLFLLLALPGCVNTPHTRVEGWPAMKVREVVVPAGDIWGLCSPGMKWYHRALLSVPVACAHIDFVRGECTVFVAETTTAVTREHEHMHCEGWDHDGILADGFDAYRRAQQSARASAECVAEGMREAAPC